MAHIMIANHPVLMEAAAELEQTAHRLGETLKATGRRIVFAESCTAGLVPAMLARTPGTSEFLCGSCVVYRNGSKAAWLDVPQELLDDREIGPVSEPVARAMARGALERTPEATVAVSVTGHLGPEAPEGFDGVVWLGWAHRETGEVTAIRKQLSGERPERTDDPGVGRIRRQYEAARLVMEVAIEELRRGR
ncbi:Nicotinamide-nucleotide amidohydrolase PncC [Maioricimonas rarisocia]|uniref:Nicotinamide-nucleotide amidohydrolase PncC n=1 Tax=Maioricimonas rarisocia TaxID=2528026 RepID=A0A517ZES0_9PLAN|nr:nicotinamide-nucleotide amidohydrolase family protein [Maioricimonas rarisocia]QDU40972.1 Nicotinamide-nucleotide amidohydrolase PncC [Maioricimonas rarisocia]